MIQPGDVVEALHDMQGWPPVTFVKKGFRTIVVETSQKGHCLSCNQDSPGLFLADLPLTPTRAWCVNHWRKIGGREQSVGKFAEDLNVRLPLFDHDSVT